VPPINANDFTLVDLFFAPSPFVPFVKKYRLNIDRSSSLCIGPHTGMSIPEKRVDKMIDLAEIATDSYLRQTPFPVDEDPKGFAWYNTS
jgi:hypothetical protein